MAQKQTVDNFSRESVLKGKRERKVGWFLQRGGGSKYKGEIFLRILQVVIKQEVSIDQRTEGRTNIITGYREISKILNEQKDFIIKCCN